MNKKLPVLLLVSVFIIATCGLIYELIAGTLASYLLGDSVTQFSTIIGVYLFSMGVGSWVSKYFDKNLLAWFIRIEILVGLVGGTSSSILFMVFESVSSFRIILYGLISFTGVLVGLEIPLLMRILEGRFEFKDLVSKVFTFDYIGALIASLVFPLLLIPYLGLVRTAYLFGMLNVLVALITCINFRHEIKGAKYLQSASIISLLALLVGFVYANTITSFSESLTYSDTIIFSKSTPYQRIIITKKGRDLRLFLNGNLQFSSVDEYRYHEALIHPVLEALPNAKNILVMGGGDGLAVREILKYPQIETVTLVDLDKEMTKLFRSNDMLLKLNRGSLLSPKVTVTNADAFSWARAQHKAYDAIIIDFPDPSNYSVGKLYTNTFYNIVKHLLKPDGIMVVQSTSPYVAPKSYWTVEKTLQSVGLHTVPYHNYVPSFGEWGYIMAMNKPVYKVPDHYLPGLRFMSKACLEQMLYFPADMARVPAQVNKLNNQILVKYFEDEWATVYSSNNGIKPTSRRAFMLQVGLVTGAILFNGCIRKLSGGKPQYAHIKGKLTGPNAKAGHAMRDKLPMPPPASKQTVKTLIIGSGISGLSAARWLLKQGEQDFQVLELENHAGGNSYFGSNEVSSYPLGAHYLPIVNNDDKLLFDFLHEHKVITHFDEKGLPFYNEFYLCFDPEERLLINGHWQEGIVPDFGVADSDRKQIIRFFNTITQLKNARGNDGKYAFDIPLDNSSADESFRKLDSISFDDYLKENGFNSPYLLWYLNYCCKDDYGTPAQNVSAWAGLHYFSARKGTAANAEPNAVITWPEGNGWLMKQLRETVKAHIKTGHLAYNIQLEADGKVAVNVLDLKKNASTVIYADRVIMASPQYVNQKLLKGITRPGFDVSKLHYSPWLIANITVNKLPTAEKGMVLCWDNVAYNTASVGYVNANQQDVKLVEAKKVLTYYLPLCDKEPRIARLAAYTRTHQQWLDIVLPEMEKMHPGITPNIEQVEMWLWGHGMISPSVNYIWGGNRVSAGAPIDNKIFFAHTDLSGVSIFEEAFHQGIRAAQQLLNNGHGTA